MKSPIFLVMLASMLFASDPAAADNGLDPTGAAPGKVMTGIDVLRREEFRQLAGRNVGLITNHTGLDRSGTSTITLLFEAPNVNLVTLFSPEHGLHGSFDIPLIEDSEDAGTGIRVHSLYGQTRKPQPETMQGIDTLVFDIQDIGTRYYTYISTMGLAMQAAAEQGIRFMVLDRPNPITGVVTGGPVSDEGRTSFTAFHPIPVRHGMTVGELALMFKSELRLDLELEVVALEHWQRSWFFDQTGLRWINPSPNMRSLTQALLYPGIGLLETTNLSVGRGTDTPFEVIGAPWLDGDAFAYALNQRNIPGVAFVPIRFTPLASKFEGEACGGINIIITDRARFDPVRTGLAIAVLLQRTYPGNWDLEAMNRLLVDDETLRGIRDRLEVDAIEAAYQPALERFRQRRNPFLIYP